jgi:hypothetical protein
MQLPLRRYPQPGVKPLTAIAPTRNPARIDPPPQITPGISTQRDRIADCLRKPPARSHQTQTRQQKPINPAFFNRHKRKFYCKQQKNPNKNLEYSFHHPYL